MNSLDEKDAIIARLQAELRKTREERDFQRGRAEMFEDHYELAMRQRRRAMSILGGDYTDASAMIKTRKERDFDRRMAEVFKRRREQLRQLGGDE